MSEQRSRSAIALVALVAGVWLSAGVAPLVGALEGARRPIDFVRDYVAARALLQDGRGAPPEGDAGNDYAAAWGAPRVELLGGPYHLHPPPATLPVLPLATLDFAGAAYGWLALSLTALAALTFLLVAPLAGAHRPTAAQLGGAFMLVALWPPVLHDLEKGQWSILLAALIAAGLWALETDRPRAAGTWLGLAASFKAAPFLLLGFLMLRHRRAALAMVATMAVMAGLSVAVGGLAPWRAFAAGVPRDVAAWQTWIANTASLHGLLARLLVGGAFATPALEAARAVRALDLVLGAGLVALVVSATLRAPRTVNDDRRLFAAWTVLVVLLNPLAWTHTLVIALVPLALLAQGPRRGLTAAALVLLTIPRETLAALAGPIPVSPARGLALSVHAVALLMMFGVALSARPADAPAL